MNKKKYYVPEWAIPLCYVDPSEIEKTKYTPEKEKKKFQRSDWLSRPLSESQLNYAANDALYLIELRNKMYKILNNDKEFNKIKKNFNIDIKNKLVFRKNKKEEEFKDIAGNFIDENMTVLKENEYFKQSKDISY